MMQYPMLIQNVLKFMVSIVNDQDESIAIRVELIYEKILPAEALVVWSA